MTVSKEVQLALLRAELLRLEAEIESDSCEKCHGYYRDGAPCSSDRHARIKRIRCEDGQ